MHFILGLFILFMIYSVVRGFLSWISYWLCMPFGLNYESPIPNLDNRHSLEVLLKDLNYSFEEYIPGSDCELVVNGEARRRYEALCKARERNALKGRIFTSLVFVGLFCAVFFHYYRISIY